MFILDTENDSLCKCIDTRCTSWLLIAWFRWQSTIQTNQSWIRCKCPCWHRWSERVNIQSIVVPTFNSRCHNIWVKKILKREMKTERNVRKLFIPFFPLNHFQNMLFVSLKCTELKLQYFTFNSTFKNHNDIDKVARNGIETQMTDPKAAQLRFQLSVPWLNAKSNKNRTKIK